MGKGLKSVLGAAVAAASIASVTTGCIIEEPVAKKHSHKPTISHPEPPSASPSFPVCGPNEHVDIDYQGASWEPQAPGTPVCMPDVPTPARLAPTIAPRKSQPPRPQHKRPYHQNTQPIPPPPFLSSLPRCITFVDAQNIPHRFCR